MKITNISAEAVPSVQKESKYLSLATDFLAGDAPALKIEPEDGETGNAIQSGFRSVVRIHHLPIEVALRKQTVYLSKVEQEKEQKKEQAK